MNICIYKSLYIKLRKDQLHFCNFKDMSKLGIVVYACNPSSLEAETGGSLRVQSQPGLYNESNANLNYNARLCLSFSLFLLKQGVPKLPGLPLYLQSSCLSIPNNQEYRQVSLHPARPLFPQGVQMALYQFRVLLVPFLSGEGSSLLQDRVSPALGKNCKCGISQPVLSALLFCTCLQHKMLVFLVWSWYVYTKCLHLFSHRPSLLCLPPNWPWAKTVKQSCLVDLNSTEIHTFS